MRVIVCGSRYWTDVEKVADRLNRLPGDTQIITGGARGADKIAHDVANWLCLGTLVIEANWTKHGKRAGPIRNREMLDCRPSLVIAFHSDFEHSKGTKDCVFEANKRGIAVEIIA
jgi:hypothetical protein